MVIMRGMAMYRVANPNRSINPPTSSAETARNAINHGSGRPNPHSVLPNQSTVLSKAANFVNPAEMKIGAR